MTISLQNSHNNCIDLKSLNLLVAKSGTVKVADFGLSISRESSLNETKPKGTIHWMAPVCYYIKYNPSILSITYNFIGSCNSKAIF